MLQGPVPAGQFAASLEVICAAVHAEIAWADAGSSSVPRRIATTDEMDARRLAPCSGCLVVRL